MVTMFVVQVQARPFTRQKSHPNTRVATIHVMNTSAMWKPKNGVMAQIIPIITPRAMCSGVALLRSIGMCRR